MHFRILGLCLLLISGTVFSAPGRSPAVEDFVGIEIDETKASPHGSESLYNLEQDLGKIESVRKNVPQAENSKESLFSPEKGVGVTTIFAILVFMGLPLLIWMLVMNHLRNKASAESASNIELLEKYRQERQEAHRSAKEKDIKKAS